MVKQQQLLLIIAKELLQHAVPRVAALAATLLPQWNSLPDHLLQFEYSDSKGESKSFGLSKEAMKTWFETDQPDLQPMGTEVVQRLTNDQFAKWLYPQLNRVPHHDQFDLQDQWHLPAAVVSAIEDDVNPVCTFTNELSSDYFELFWMHRIRREGHLLDLNLYQQCWATRTKVH